MEEDMKRGNETAGAARKVQEEKNQKRIAVGNSLTVESIK
jgi:hypothetical protein